MGPKLRSKELKQVQGQDMRVPRGAYSKYACSDCPLIPGTPLYPLLKKKKKKKVFKMPLYSHCLLHFYA